MNTVLNHFMDKVSPEPNTGCWLWTAYIDEDGYGRFWYKSRWGHAHRAAMELFQEAIPAKKVIDHKCRERSCVNPTHLRIATDRENLMATNSLATAKKNVEKTHCPQGHEYSEENIYKWKTARYCRECGNSRRREAYHKSVRMGV